MENQTTPCKALVLAGGGARGSYQVGVWRALAELGWRPQIITGTSVGSLNGAMFALDLGLARDILVEREAATRGHVRPVAGRGVGAFSLVWRDVQRLARFPRPIVGVGGAVLVRYVRSAFIEVLQTDYCRTAGAIGWRRWPALLRHGVRNAALQIVTVLGLQLATGEVVLAVDGDTSFDNDMVRHMACHFNDPAVIGVAGNLRVRNAGVNLLTRLQALEGADNGAGIAGVTVGVPAGHGGDLGGAGQVALAIEDRHDGHAGIGNDVADARIAVIAPV